ncbi:uncharacterized protein LOC113315396 [Papaver somniferum]|uniref:uncharacterized protein LOC113315396 n=1 Tax=Papaver somniferum TaxID=3469 RepID=UPI000E7027A9|nr:uncharacterized protein LOC113315396 [Papaver somniferum]
MERRHGLIMEFKLINLTHLCFADDVMIFLKVIVAAASSLKSALIEFSSYSGLEINNQKTSLFFSVVDEDTLQQIFLILDCSQGELPVRYLGIPLLSTILSYRDCLPLLEKVDDRIYSWKSKSIVYPETKVADFLINDSWFFPNFMEDEVQNVVAQISSTDFNVSEIDQIFWKPSTSGQFSIKDTYISISDHLVSQDWMPLVWFKKHIPIHSFISWISIHKILKTRNKLLKWGITADASCVLCGNAVESEDHIFHACMYSASIWQGLLLKHGYIKELESSWDEEIRWCNQHFTGTSCVTTIKKLVLNGFSYHIWRERNNRVFRATSNSQDQVSMLIVQHVRFKMLSSTLKEDDNPSTKWFMSRWSIDCIFILPETIFCTWLYPDDNEIMINTDGSKYDSAGGFGAILRDNTAEVIEAASGNDPFISGFAHELQGVELGFKMAIKKNLFRVHLATDSMAVYNLLTNPNFEPPWNVLQIWRRVKRLRERFEVCRVSHCYKETNRAAD